jgi:hypothetical protein
MKFSIPFFLTLFILTSLSTSSTISFNEEQKKIMAKFNSLLQDIQSPAGIIMSGCSRFPVEDILRLDPIVFFREMQNVTDSLFLLIFWYIFRDLWDFVFFQRFTCNTKEHFIAHTLITGGSSRRIAFNMLRHFKIYLMQSLATYQGDKMEMFEEARKFYTFQLKKLILEVVVKKNCREISLLKQMNRNFRFYYRCVEKDNIKLMFRGEFSMFRSLLKSSVREAFETHSENMAFLAGILMHDRSTIYGLSLFSDQSPDLIVYFILMQILQFEVLNGATVHPSEWRSHLFKYLFKKIPIFEEPANPKLPQKFKLLKEFTNDYEDILSWEELIYLAKTLYGKIIRFYQ